MYLGRTQKGGLENSILPPQLGRFSLSMDSAAEMSSKFFCAGVLKAREEEKRDPLRKKGRSMKRIYSPDLSQCRYLCG
jgi:hypothetical protein